MERVDLIGENWDGHFEDALCSESNIINDYQNDCQQYDENDNTFKPSAYTVLEKYLKCAKIVEGGYVIGFIDGEDNYNNVS